MTRLEEIKQEVETIATEMEKRDKFDKELFNKWFTLIQEWKEIDRTRSYE